MKALWLPAVMLLSSCGGVDETEVGWRPLHGTPHVAPKTGFTFYWVGPSGKYLTPEQTATEIDTLFFDWCAVYEARWGFGLSRDQRKNHLQRIKIQLFQGNEIPGKSAKDHEIGIYWPWEHQVDVAMDAAHHWDRGLNMWSEGLQVLRHEWSHVFQGAYHP